MTILADAIAPLANIRFTSQDRCYIGCIDDMREFDLRDETVLRIDDPQPGDLARRVR